MMALRGFLSLALLVTTIIYSSNSQSVLNIEKETGVTNYGKNSASRNSLIMIRNETRCGLKLASIMDQVTKLYMPENNLLCMLTDKEIENDCLSNAFEEFLKLGRTNVITIVSGARNFDSHFRIYQKPAIYFLLGVDLSTVLQSLINLGKIGGIWNPRGLYISIAESKEKATELMTNLWKQFVYKVIVLIFRNNTLDTIEAYTWHPYYPDNYCGPPTAENIIRLGKFTETLQFQKETDTEPGMMSEKFGNCPLNVSYNVWEPYIYSRAEDQHLAVEGRLIEMICEKMRVKINPKYHSLNLTLEPSEAWAGTRIPMSFALKFSEITIPYIEDSLIWIVPCCNEIHLFEITDGLPESLWYPSALAMISASLSLLASRNQHWILLVWGSLLEQADYKVANNIRGIWACWLLLCLHLSVAYKTVLVSHLTYPSTRSEIQNQSDLLASGLELGFISGSELWFDEEDEIEKKIVQRHVTCETVKECYKEIPLGKAVFTNKMYADYLNHQKDEMGSIAEKVRQLPTSLTYRVAMIYTKGHAMLPRFDKLLRSTLQSGFIDHWTKEIEEMHTRKNMNKLNFTREQGLTLAQVHGGFHVLGSGLITAGVFLILEIFSHLLWDKFLIYIKRATSFWNHKPEK